MPVTKSGAYLRFDDEFEVRNHYHYARTVKDFVVSPAYLEKHKPRCACCGSTVRQRPRGEYDPATREIRIMHYECAWKETLSGALARTR